MVLTTGNQLGDILLAIAIMLPMFGYCGWRLWKER